MTDLSSQAIRAALSSDWQKAVELNSEILKADGDEGNVDCLNRLGKAYLELGDNKKAATILRKVLKIDKYDPIATRNLARATTSGSVKKTLPGSQTPVACARNPSPDFLEEPGKTKLVPLVNLAPMRVLLKLNQADAVTLIPKRHTVVAENREGAYLGSLPDDIGHRLSILIKGGNHYGALAKSVSKSSLVIFIRELTRVKKFADTPSFIANSQDYFSYIRDELLTDAPVETDADPEDDTPASAKLLHADEEPEAA